MTWSLSFSDSVRDGNILRRLDIMPQLYPIGSLPHGLHLSIISDWTLAHPHTSDLPKVRVIFLRLLFSFRRLRHRSSWPFISAPRAFNFLLESSITCATSRCERHNTDFGAHFIDRREGWIPNNPRLSFSIFPFIMVAWSLNVLCWSARLNFFLSAGSSDVAHGPGADLHIARYAVWVLIIPQNFRLFSVSFPLSYFPELVNDFPHHISLLTPCFNPIYAPDLL